MPAPGHPRHRPRPLSRRALVPGVALHGGIALILFVGGLAGCRRNSATAAATAPTAAAVAVPAPDHSPWKSTDCLSCHEPAYKSWEKSHHALAHRPVNATADADAFQSPREISVHGVDYQLAWKEGKPAFTEKRPNLPADHYTADFALGYTPLRQYIVPAGGGRYQAAELAFDPEKKDWFNVFGDERRQPGEWGHWRGRGMNWNSMCAHCHFTDFRKKYDSITDTYASTWREHGVGCAQCHGDLAPTHAGPNPPVAKPGVVRPPSTPADRKRAQETCAPCHARNELLTGTIVAGGSYSDHYRLTLPTEAAVFYPDGQMRDEDFNYTSLLTSRMGGKAGVTCLDCHDPHSGKTILPVQNNMLCQQCHGAPGRQNAPVIDPLAHSHHAEGSTGNQCVTCHMPTTTFMQRDPRHDHGFIKPDPLLTKELDIPNACNRCHTDKSVDWAIEHSNTWYGAKLDSRQRARTRVVAAAQAGAPDAGGKLLDLIAGEDVPAWKATLLLVARPYAAVDPRVAVAARRAIDDPEPIVRSAAAQVLTSLPGTQAALRPLLQDPSRLVRLDAAWALSAELADSSPERRELDAYLAISADQPAGRLRIGQDLFNRGRAAAAEAPLRKAVEWDPNSGGMHEALGLVLDSLGRSAEAAGSLWRAAQLSPTDANAAFSAALAFAGAGKLPDAELALRETLRRNPRLDRAWYNLGLLLAQTNRLADAIPALQQAEGIAPGVADYPYARATLLWQRGDRPGAIAAARRALEIDPARRDASELIRRSGG